MPVTTVLQAANLAVVQARGLLVLTPEVAEKVRRGIVNTSQSLSKAFNLKSGSKQHCLDTNCRKV